MSRPTYRADETNEIPHPHHHSRVPDEILSDAIEALYESNQPLVKVATIIQQNPLLETLFLRYANAAEHGFKESIISTDRGVALLGSARLASFLRALRARTKAIGSPSLR